MTESQEQFMFSEKNEEFVRLLTLLGTAIRENDDQKIKLAKQEYSKLNIIIGFKDETQQIVLMVEDKPYYFDLTKYDGVKEAEIITE
jgi:hypothetical protein